MTRRSWICLLALAVSWCASTSVVQAQEEPPGQVFDDLLIAYSENDLPKARSILLDELQKDEVSRAGSQPVSLLTRIRQRVASVENRDSWLSYRRALCQLKKEMRDAGMEVEPAPQSGTLDRTEQGDEDSLLRTGGDVVPPEKLYAPNPEYTSRARRVGTKGTVIAEVTIDREGCVRQAKILKGLPMGLSEAALETSLRWVFKPATLNGEPVAVYYNLTFNFGWE